MTPSKSRERLAELRAQPEHRVELVDASRLREVEADQEREHGDRRQDPARVGDGSPHRRQNQHRNTMQAMAAGQPWVPLGVDARAIVMCAGSLLAIAPAKAGLTTRSMTSAVKTR